MPLSIYMKALYRFKPVYQELFDWIEENGCKPKGLYYEYYFNSPGDVAEKNLSTRIVIPVEK